MSFKTSDFRVLTTGLQYPEGPLYQQDGSVLVVEIQGKKLTRVLPDGTKETVANLGGGPNGAAMLRRRKELEPLGVNRARRSRSPRC